MVDLCRRCLLCQQKSSLRKTFDRLTGGIFIGFGVALLASRP